jgi:glycerol-3-phosphate acyltransferase PlsY
MPAIFDLILIIGSYLLGSLSAAIIVCKLLGLQDPRTTGSRNPGATNVLRIGGKLPALIVLFGDALKGFIPVAIGHLFHVSPVILGLIALAALLGHVFPIFFRFEGGKGVATAAGAVLALSPTLFLFGLITWLVVAVFSRISSLSALVTVTLIPMYAIMLNENSFCIPLILMVILVLWRHKENIARLANGTEPRVGKKK